MKKPVLRAENPVLPPQPPPMVEILAARAETYADRTLVDFDDRSLSYRGLLEESRCVAAGLQRVGVGKGDPVIFVISNRSEYLVAFFAAAWAGAVVVPVNVALKGESLAHVFRTSRARTALIEQRFVARIREALGDNEMPEHVIVVGDSDATGADDEPLFGALAARHGEPDRVEVAAGDPCMIMFTSGTTGVAKGVTMPHQQVSSAAWDAMTDMQIGEESVFYTFYPLFHLNGLIYGPLAALIAGGQAVVRSEFPRDRVWSELRRYHATHWCSLPFLNRAMLAAPPQDDDAKNDLRYVMTFGLLDDEIDAMQDRFDIKLLAGYGMTETGMVCRLQSDRPATAGRVSNRFQLRIVDSEGRDVASGEVGEIWVRTRQTHDSMLGYCNMPEATAAAFEGEWFRTGDLGRMDQEGYLYFVDRVKESLKRRGQNISTFEVEKVLMSFPGITTAAVVGFRPGLDTDDEVRAFVESSAKAIDYAALIRHCADNLAYYMIPRFIDVTEQLPRTPVGKIRKQVLRELPLSSTTFDVKLSDITIER